MTYGPAILLLQVLLAVRDIDAQPRERLRRGAVLRRSVPAADLPPLGTPRRLRLRLLIVGGFAGVRALRGWCDGGDGGIIIAAEGDNFGREDRELMREVLGAEMAVEQLVRPAGRPGTFYEDGGERGGYLGRRGAPDGDVLRLGSEAVRGDVAEEEELLARGVVPDEEGRGLVVAQRVVLAVQHGHRPDRNVREDRPVVLVER